MVKFNLKSELGYNTVAQTHSYRLLNTLGGILRHEIEEWGTTALLVEDYGTSWTIFLYWDQM